MIPIKNESDLATMRQAGAIIARILRELERHVRQGISTAQLDEQAAALMEREKVLPAFKGYRGFPAHICVSVNEEIVHGIPGDRKIQNGDIVSIDIGINHQGFFSDMAVTVPVGTVAPETRKLIEATRKSLQEAIRFAKPDNRLTDISSAVQNYVERHGFSVVRQFVGHGIGRALHEEPEVPNFGRPHQGPVLKKGMVLAIEPMVNMGSWECAIQENGWTAVTKDGRASAHFEHTVAITEAGPEILTR